MSYFLASLTTNESGKANEAILLELATVISQNTPKTGARILKVENNYCNTFIFSSFYSFVNFSDSFIRVTIEEERFEVLTYVILYCMCV